MKDKVRAKITTYDFTIDISIFKRMGYAFIGAFISTIIAGYGGIIDMLVVGEYNEAWTLLLGLVAGAIGAGVIAAANIAKKPYLTIINKITR